MRTLRKVLERMESVEKRLLLVGFLLYLFLPMVKNHPAATSYVGNVAVPLYEGIASALFFFGALAFTRILHEIREK
ncbi:MAG: hypothetical protein ACOX3E_13530 [Desulfomonilia bacterium]|nr:hypothetical protein [Deltaproteobacteria bacterium]HRS56791.1 hypothetical protein [Desulfomonilia bacterium]HRV36541.1 hypothetical protein [Desulfomonilia bacterium]